MCVCACAESLCFLCVCGCVCGHDGGSGVCTGEGSAVAARGAQMG